MLVWHYTSIDVLITIFSHNSGLPTLRASNVLYLNDSSELKHGLERVVNKLNDNPDIRNSSELQLTFSDYLKHDNDHALYSFSVSEDCDSLYQWLVYCPPDQGGVALGFEIPDNLDDSENQEFFVYTPKFPGQIQKPRYRPCKYIAKNQPVPDGFITIEKNPSTTLLTNAMFIKHPAFKFENEHRLFFHPMKEDTFGIPVLGGVNKPYIEFHFNPKILKKVCVSPRKGKSEYKALVSRVLKSVSNLEHVEVLESDIPYRDQ